MSWGRINELTALINSLVSKRSDLKNRIRGLEGVLPDAGKAQTKVNEAVISAKNRLNALEAFGMSGAFLEDIIAPVQNAPNCSGLASFVKKEIEDTDSELDDTQKRINNACWEKDCLEKELMQL